MITFFAPASKCMAAFSRLVNTPVHSQTKSTFKSDQGRSVGLRSLDQLITSPLNDDGIVCHFNLLVKAAVNRVELE